MDMHGGCIFALPSLMIFDALGKIRENMENIGKYSKLQEFTQGSRKIPEMPKKLVYKMLHRGDEPLLLLGTG